MKVVENYEILVLDNSDIKGFKKANKIEVKVSIDRGKQNTSGSTSIFYCIRASLPQILDRVRDYALMNPECHNAKVTFEISNDKGNELNLPGEIYTFYRDLMTVLTAQDEDQVQMVFEFNKCNYTFIDIISMVNEATYVFTNCTIDTVSIAWSTPNVMLHSSTIKYVEVAYARTDISVKRGSTINKIVAGLSDVTLGIDSDISNLFLNLSRLDIYASKDCKVSMDSKKSTIRCSKNVDVTFKGDIDCVVEHTIDWPV